MPSHSTQQSKLTRRGFLGATMAAGVLLIADPSPIIATAADSDRKLEAEGISVVASVGGRIAIGDRSGKVHSQGSKFQIKDKTAGVLTSTGGTPTFDPASGGKVIRMDYVMPPEAGGITVYCLVSVSTNHAHLEWHVSGPTTLLPEAFLFTRAIVDGTAGDFVPVTRWARDAGGGIPYEEQVGVAYTATWSATKHGMFLLADSKLDWSSSSGINAPGVQQPDGSYVSQTDFYFSETKPSATAVIGTGKDLGIELSTDKAFNIWDAAGQTMSVTALVANGAATARTVALSWWVRDFNGAQLASQTVSLPVSAMGTATKTFTVAAPAYGIAVAEVSAKVGAVEAFARTNLTVMPAQSYTPSATSMFGMANYPWLKVPSEAAVLDLWQKVGVQRVRIAYDGGPGVPPSVLDARGIRHNLELQPQYSAVPPVPYDPVAYATSSLNTAVLAGAEYFEAGNELNRPFNSGQGVQDYITKALRPVVDYAKTLPRPPKILNMGLAGMDKPWVDTFIAAGGWNLIDGFAYHPGRGNFTPDAIPDGSWEAGATGKYWNFYGGLKQLKALMQTHGQKEIWLTEAYACTRPNDWWNDTYRTAAENVFLTMALAKAEGVKCVLWYQFHDSVLGRPQVADPVNREYHFGLMNRDVSAKPSLLAYATAAKVFDRATFVGWAKFTNPQNKGLLFDSPDGKFAVLWNRADGYILNKNHGTDPDRHFPAPEMWVDPWPTKTNLMIEVTGTGAYQLDAIGQRTNLQLRPDSVPITLDGAPRVFYGLDIEPTRAI